MLGVTIAQDLLLAFGKDSVGNFLLLWAWNFLQVDDLRITQCIEMAVLCGQENLG